MMVTMGTIKKLIKYLLSLKITQCLLHKIFMLLMFEKLGNEQRDREMFH